METNVEFVKNRTLFSDGKQVLRGDLKEQKYAKHVPKLKMYAKLVYLIYNMDCQCRLEINLWEKTKLLYHNQFLIEIIGYNNKPIVLENFSCHTMMKV